MIKSIIEKNERYELEITDVSSDGNGVAHKDGFVIFVPYTAPEDVAEVTITKVKKSYAEGKLVKLIQASDKRETPKCPIYEQCGGCRIMHINYEEQTKIKRGFIENAMRRIGGFKDLKCEDMLIGGNPYRYRNKCIFSVGTNDLKKAAVGFYQKGTHTVAECRDCAIGSEKNRGIIRALTEYIQESGVSIYDEKEKKGLIRRLFIRTSNKTGEVMVVVVVNGDDIPIRQLLVDKLKTAENDVASVYVNINKDKMNNLLSAENKLIYGKREITDSLCGLQFNISPNSFYQINPHMTQRLYDKALEYADIARDDNVLDIYCGIGTISLAAAGKAKSVIGIEIAEQAIADAKENAGRNGITNAKFYAESAEKAVPELIEKGFRPDVVILDPPRKGSDKETLNAIAKAKPKRIVYISCAPATLARDAKFLNGLGYEPKKLCGADMFPHTHHVETVVLMSRVNE